jgi:hypothetical protein
MRSLPPAAPTSARWAGRTSPIRTGRCTRQPALGYAGQHWPSQYLTARRQLERNLAKARQI